jgi:hypothetical protein
MAESCRFYLISCESSDNSFFQFFDEQNQRVAAVLRLLITILTLPHRQ